MKLLKQFSALTSKSQTRQYMRSMINNYIKVTEVGPRDGLQNETKIVPKEVKVEFIDKLSDCGFDSVEVTSFVSPKWVPQMADNVEVMNAITKNDRTSYPVLVPNIKGFEAALSTGAREIAIFGSASEAFSKKNLNCSVSESIERFREVTVEAKKHNVQVRGYVSCIVGCPYEGPVRPSQVAKATEALLELGCYEVSLGDTIGVGTPGSMKKMLLEVFHVAKPEQLALHCHDTYGQALANVMLGLNSGIKSFDSSVSGLGGCPYAKGASGNLATEDLIYMLMGSGLETGVDLMKVIEAGRFICKYLDKPNMSKVNNAVSDKFKSTTDLKIASRCFS